jgi:hypothetical protein
LISVLLDVSPSDFFVAEEDEELDELLRLAWLSVALSATPNATAATSTNLILACMCALPRRHRLAYCGGHYMLA